MVGVKAVDVGRKRKMADTDETPPKRVTRARTKAAEAAEPKLKITTIKTPSVKAAARMKTQAPVAETAMQARKTESSTPIVGTSKTGSMPTKRRGKAKKDLPPVEMDTTTNQVSTRIRKEQGRNTVEAGEEQPKTTKTRGRPRKEAQPAQIPEIKTKNLRSKTGKIPEASEPINGSSTKPTISRKKVTFHEGTNNDKENVSIDVKEARKQQKTSLGLRARPVRKTVLPKGTTSTRGRKATPLVAKNDGGDGNTKEAQHDLPLSPKKVLQVAKSSSNTSGDEKHEDKMPVGDGSQSPAKLCRNGPQCVVLGSPSRSALSVSSLQRSPSKVQSSAILQSPARRPPPSPLKDVLKESPRKFKLADPLGQLSRLSSTSPKKTSLLKSPARRPQSPTKLVAPCSPEIASTTAPLEDTMAFLHHTKDTAYTKSARKNLLSSPVRAANPPVLIPDIHRSPLKELHAVEQVVPADQGDHTPSGPGSNIEASMEDLDDSLDCLTTPAPSTKSTHTVGRLPLQNIEDFTIYAVNETEIPRSISRDEDQTQRPTNVMGSTKSHPDPFALASPALRHVLEDDDSEDELQSGGRFDSRSGNCHLPEGTPTPGAVKSTVNDYFEDHVGLAHESVEFSTKVDDLPMTPLALQFSSWLTSSPNQKPSANRASSVTRTIDGTRPKSTNMGIQLAPSIDKPQASFFDDEMVIRQQENELVLDDDPMDLELDEIVFATTNSQESQEPKHYGDENAVPTETQTLALSAATCTPARIVQRPSWEVHTVSKVPLRPSSEDSPSKVFRKRSRSVSTPLKIHSKNASHTIDRHDSKPPKSVHTVPGFGMENGSLQQHQRSDKMARLASIQDNGEQDMRTFIASPAKTPRNGADAEILRGAVVHVDVHTMEGEDASSIFTELLTQMGARTVKSWAWNPHASSCGGLEGTATPDGKVGITHVVFKDGGKRTLEKVRASKGLVQCVGVGWVLEYVISSHFFCRIMTDVEKVAKGRTSGSTSPIIASIPQ